MIDEHDTRRKFPRIFLVGLEDLKELIGARVTWPDRQVVDVFDMSYSGASMKKPDRLELEPGKELMLLWEIAGSSPFPVPCKLVRGDEKMVAIQFLHLSTDALRIFDEFLNDKLLGRHTALVNPKFYGDNQTFKYWFHGPRDTNVFLWTEGERIDRATVELDGLYLQWDGSRFHQKQLRSDVKAWDDSYVGPEDLLLEEVDLEPEFLARVLKIFTQVQNPPPAMWALLDLIKTAVKR